jgi:hypothetical protein
MPTWRHTVVKHSAVQCEVPFHSWFWFEPLTDIPNMNWCMLTIYCPFDRSFFCSWPPNCSMEHAFHFSVQNQSSFKYGSPPGFGRRRALAPASCVAAAACGGCSHLAVKEEPSATMRLSWAVAGLWTAFQGGDEEGIVVPVAADAWERLCLAQHCLQDFGDRVISLVV